MEAEAAIVPKAAEHRGRGTGQSRLPMPQLNSTVLQGTPLRQMPDLHSNISPTSLFRLPKLHEGTALKQFLRRKHIISRLIPREESRKDVVSAEVTDPRPDKECDVSIMIRALKLLQDPFVHRFCPSFDASNPRQKPLRLRKLRNSLAPREPIEAVLSATPYARRSAEVLPSESKAALHSRNSRKTESVTPMRLLFDLQEEKKAELIRGLKITMREPQYRSPLNTSCPIVLPSDLPAKLPPKPRKQRKPLDLKPTPEQLQTILAGIWSQFDGLVAESNGISQRTDGVYKYFVGPGNNSQLVAQVVKKRWFWVRVDDWEQADFVWTQNKQQSIVDTLGRAEVPVAKVGKGQNPQQSCKKVMKVMTEEERRKAGIALIEESLVYTPIEPQATLRRLYNRLERNYQLTSKKRLFLNLKSYSEKRGIDVFSLVPVTFHLEKGRRDPEFNKFVAKFQEIAADIPHSHNLWIIKPGEGTNCGHGIHVSSDLNEIKDFISDKFSHSGRKRTYIIQKYLEKPLLVHRRKFDIRAYGLMTAFNGHVQGYFYHDGYLRTSSKEFSLKNSNRFVHLTNDAVQKKSEDYGKFESGNKMSYSEFQKYLETQWPGQVDFYRDLWPQIKALVTHSFEATSHSVDPEHRTHTFEVLGYDFMIDEDFKVWLIEVNTNPCLALSSSGRVGIVLDAHFLEPEGKKKQEWSGQAFVNKFELVFSSVACSQVNPEDSEADVSLSSDDLDYSLDGN